MGLIDRYKQDLVSKVFLYVSNGNKSLYCIGKITSLVDGGAGFKVICTNIFSYKDQWFCKNCLIDLNSEIIVDVNLNYLGLFQKFNDDLEE